ncbi:2-hydroxy-3-oxopropionate reductase [Palleronia abyssalis]|uniref:2-hydroxy-3-oxopropionate reductase n=2 Tax=Palleronia abyssalis TaxID=1501240 RepID=A0A2R8BWV1_9RHOB|nr:2-hydroxy-3-oxopropionate reductase [Palleronia abyssalis]
MSKPTIGFIGVGYMGHGMAKNLIASGYPLVVKGNRNRDPVEDLLTRGAQEAATPREVAERSDIVHLCLSNSAQVEAVIRGEDGILASGKDGLVVIDTTTADPTSSDTLAAELEAAQMTLVDAPLGRTPKEAEAGTLDTMVGATPEMFERLRPVIACWAGNISHTGGTGSGHRMKLIMNFISMGYAALYSEALATGVKSGLTPQTIHRVIGSSRMANGFYETFMAYAIGRDPEAHKFTIQNGAKDTRYAASMARDAEVANLLGAAIANSFQLAESAGHGDDYVPMLADIVARQNGFDLAKAVRAGHREED